MYMSTTTTRATTRAKILLLAAASDLDPRTCQRGLLLGLDSLKDYSADRLRRGAFDAKIDLDALRAELRSLAGG